MRSNGGRRWAGIGLATLLTLGASGAPTAAHADVAPLLAAGPTDSPIVVTAVTLVENDATVALSWTDPAGVGAFEVLRDGVAIKDVGAATTFEDVVAVGATHEYSVRALDGAGDPIIGSTVVVAAPAARGCDFMWTGAVDSEFADADNWAPIGLAPAAPRPPEAGDHACLDSRQNTPATSSAAGAGVGSASTTLDAAPELPALLDIAGGTFAVTDRFVGVDLTVTGGEFSTTGLTEFRLLTVTDGRLALSGSVEAAAGVQFGPGSPVLASANGSAVEFDVSPPQGNIVIGARLDDADLTVEGPVQLGRGGDLVVLNGTSQIIPSGSGSSLQASFVVAESGTAQVDVSVSSILRVDEGAALTVSNHQAFANGTFPPQIAVGGSLTLTQEITELGDVDLRSAASEITLNGATNTFEGLTKINDMTIDDAVDIVIPNDVQIRSLSMNNGGTFTVDGKLDFTSFLVLSDATITAPTVVTSGTGAADGDIDVFGTENRIVGDVTTDGTIRLNSDFEVDEDARLAIDGSLTLESTADSTPQLRTTVNGAEVTGRLAVRDEVVLDGIAVVSVVGSIASDVDIAAISWGSATGDIDLDLTGNTADTTIERKAGGIVVRREGGGGGIDVTDVVALGMSIDVESGAEVSLAWPSVFDAIGYRVERAGDELVETGDTTATVAQEPGTTATYTVFALGEEGGFELGSLDVFVPLRTCSVVWTGAVDDAWDEALNWAPVVKAGDALPDPAVPPVGADVCIDVNTNLPVQVDSIDVDVASVTSVLTDGQVLDVASSLFDTGLALEVPEVRVSDSLLLSGDVVVDELTVSMSEVTADSVEAFRIDVVDLGVGVTDSVIAASVSAGIVDVAADTRVAVAEFAAPATTSVVVAGHLDIETELFALAGLNLTGDGSVAVEYDADNTLSGDWTIGTLTLDGVSELQFGKSLTVGDAVIENSLLQAASTLTVNGSLAVADNGEVFAAEVVFGPSSLTRMVLDPVAGKSADVSASGRITRDGDLIVDLASAFAGPDPLVVVFGGENLGLFDATLSGPGADSVELVQDADSVRLVPAVEVPTFVLTGIDLGDGSGEPLLTFEWPADPAADSYSLFRGDVEVASVSDTTATVADDGAGTHSYQLISLDGGDPVDISDAIEVLVPKRACSVAWTGAIGDAWDEAFNWAPVVSAPDVLSNPTVPPVGAEVCVDVGTNLPVQVDSVNADLASVTSVLTDGQVLDVESSFFDTGLRLEVPEVRVSDSSLLSGAVVVDALTMSRSDVVAASVDAFRVDVVDLGVGASPNEIRAVLSAGTVDVAAGVGVVVNELGAPASTTLVLAGSLEVDTAFASLAGLNITDAGSLAVAGDLPNVLPGDWAIGTLTLDGVPELAFGKSLTVTDVLTEDSALDAVGTLTINGSLDAAKSNEVFGADVVFGPDSATRLVLDPDDSLWTEIRATGQISRDGDLLIDLVSWREAWDELVLVEGTVNVGAFDPTVIGPAADQVELVQDATNVRLVPAFAGPDVPALVLLGVDHGDGAGDPLLSLAWPPFDGAAGYRVVRDGVTVTTVTETVATVADDGKAVHQYEIVAIDDDGTPIGNAGSLAIVAAQPTCGVVWTGAVDADWHDPLNWAPVVSAGAALPDPAVPGIDDLACVATETNLPISVTTNATVDGLLTFLDPTGQRGVVDGTTVLDVVGTTFTATTGIIADGVDATDATLILGDESGLLDLRLSDANVELEGDLNVDDILSATGTSALIATGDPIIVTAPTIDVDDAFFSGDGPVTVDADLADLDAAFIGGGTRWEIDELVTSGGVNGAGFGPLALVDVTVGAGTSLAVEQIVDMAGTHFDVRGELDVTAPGRTLGSLRLDGPDAEVTVEGGAPNILTDVTAIGGLELVEADLAVESEIAVTILDLDDGRLFGDGPASFVQIASTGLASTIDATTVRLAEDPEGTLPTRLLLGDTVEPSTLTIDGDLEFAAGSETSILLDGAPANALLDVSGSVALAGSLDVSLGADVPGGADGPLITFATSTGSPATGLSGAGAASAEVVQEAGSIRLRSVVPDAETLLVAGVELGAADDDPIEVTLVWPALPGASSYEIRRDGVAVASTASTLATVTDPTAETSTYAVVGLDGGKPVAQVGEIQVHPQVAGCGVMWTGAVDSDWHDRLNWAPIVARGENLPGQRIPGAIDMACVLVDTGLPILVDEDATVDSVTTIFAEPEDGGLPTVEMLRITNARLEAAGTIFVTGATVDGGDLVTGASLLVSGDLGLSDALVRVGDVSSIGQEVRLDGAVELETTAPTPVGFFMDRLVVAAASLDVGGRVEVDAEQIELAESILVIDGSVAASELAALSGDNVTVGTPLDIGDVTVADGAILVGRFGRLDLTAFDVEGRLDLIEPTERISSLRLAGPTAVVSVDGGRENALTGVGSIGELELVDLELNVPNELSATEVVLHDAELSVLGRLAASSVTSNGLSEIDTTVLAIVDGQGVRAGLLTENSGGPSMLTITGDLVLPAGAESFVVLDSLPLQPLIDVGGDATLAGDFDVVFDEAPPRDAEFALMRWVSASGTLALQLDGADPDAARLVQRAAGVFLTGDAVQECAGAPGLLDLDVEGCWVDEGNDTFSADRDDNPDGVVIGGVRVEMDDDTTVRIDYGQNTISTTDDGGDPAPVAVSVDVSDRVDVLATVPLGDVSFDDAEFGQPIALPIDDFLGFPLGADPSLTPRSGSWGLDLGLDLPGVLRIATGLDLTIGSLGIDVGDLTIGDLSAVFGDLTGFGDLEISWDAAQRWVIDTLDLTGPTITGDIDFTELDGGGTLSVRNLRIDDWFTVPDFDLTGVFTDTTHTWVAAQPSPSALRRIGFTYTTDGALVAAAIRLGDETGDSRRDSVVTWGGWLDVDTFEIVWDDGDKRWEIVGRLASPQVDITGSYVGDGDGGTLAAELLIEGAQLGPFATIDVELGYDRAEQRYDAALQATGPTIDPIDGAGVFVFDDGDLNAADITFESISIGELVQIENFNASYLREEGRFALGGGLVGPAGETNPVAGHLAFADGQLRDGRLELDSLEVGPLSFDDLLFEFQREGDEERITSATISGSVLGPTRNGTIVDTPVTGSIEFVDGRLSRLDLRVGTIDIGGIAQIEDAVFTYEQVDADTAEIRGSGRLVTSDGTTDSAVSVVLVIRDGELVDARIEADFLSFGRAITIEDLVLIDSPVQPGTCASFDAPPGGRQWQVSGTTTSNGVTTTIDGCLVVDGRRLVGGELELGTVRIAELAVIEALELTVERSFDVPVDDPNGGKINISQTELDLSATVTVAGGAPTTVSGSASFSNGGLTALDVSIPNLDLMNIVKLRDIEFSYAGGEPWDDTADTSFALSGAVVGPNTTSTFAADVVYDADGRVTTVRIDVADVDFGIFSIDTLSFLYDASLGDDERWELTGQITIAGRPAAIRGGAIIRDGQVQTANLSIDQLVIGDIVAIESVTLAYTRDDRTGNESWSGAGSVAVAGGRADVAIDLVFDATGRLRTGFVTVDRLEWSQAIVLEDVTFSYVAGPDSTRWNVGGSITIDGETTTLSGFMNLEAGRITSGELTLINLRLGQLANIDELALTANTDGPVTDWHADIIFADGASGEGTMQWVDGRLDSAELDLADIRVGGVFTIAEAQLVYSQDLWALAATLDTDGDETSIAGAVAFDDGRPVGGSFSAENVRFGGITFDDLDLVIGDTVAFGEADVAIANVCGVADPGGPGDVFGLSATVTNEGGGTASLGGRVRVVDGDLTEGVACASNIQLGEIVTIDEFSIQASTRVDEGRTVETWAGSVQLRNPSNQSQPFVGTFDWVLVEGVTTRLAIEADNLRLSELLHFENVSFSYSRQPGLNRWAIAAELRRQGGANPAVAGVLELDGKRVTAASLDIDNVRFGNVLTLDSLSIDYVGRRATTSLPNENAGPNTWDSIPSLGTCAAAPTGANVPSGQPSTSGAESYFSVDATITTGSGPFRAAGSMGFTNGRMSAFDLSVSCLRLGDWLSIEDLRVGYTAQGSFLVAGRFVDGDDSSPDPAVRGRLDLDDGRVTGGQLNIQDVGLGAITLEELDITITSDDDGESTWALLVSVRDADGDLQTAGGSVTLLDGKIVAGSLSLPDLPLLDLLPVRNINLGFSRLNGDLTLSGSARFVKGNGSSGATVGISLSWSGGSLAGGSFDIDNFKLFNVIPVGSFSLAYDPNGPRWSGSFGAQAPGQSSSRLQAGIEVLNGRVVSGMIGFDGDNDGTVDAPSSNGDAPASGNGVLGGLPLKGFFLRFCAENSAAAFCAGIDGPQWDGALSIELPTDAAPSLDGEVRIIDGKFAGAALNVGFGTPGIPVFTGVYLNSIDAAIEIAPRLRFCGSLGATAGGPALTVATIVGGITFSEEFNGIEIPEPDGPGCGLSAPVDIPEGEEPDYYRLLIEAEAELFPGNPLGVDITGSGYLDIQTRGYLGVGAAVSVGFWNDKLVVSGEVDGSVFDANNVPATNPETGQPLTGAQAQLSGTVAATVLGREVAAAEFIVNTIGWGGCARLGGNGGLKLGATGYWSGGTRLGCKLGRVEILVPGTTNSASSNLVRSSLTASSAPLFGVIPTADTLFDVPAGEEVLGIIMRSTSGTPDTIVTSPAGVTYRVSNDFGEGGPITVSSGTEQVFIIEDPAAGTWRVGQVLGSPVLSEVDTYLGVPDPDVVAALESTDGGFAFDYSFSDIPGQSISFVERDDSGAVIGLIGRFEPGSTNVVSRSLLNRPGATVQLDSIEATGTATGSMSYRTNADSRGGTHQLVALVEQDGLPREEIVLATYDVAPASPASAPTAVQATATSTGASVTWEPPVDDGGRQIVSYRITSTKGYSVTVDGDVRSAELPIPMMVPGEDLEVYVQAFTSRGWGATGVAKVQAIAASGPAFEPNIREVGVPGSEQVIAPPVPPQPDEESVPTPVEPTSPVDPGPTTPPVDPGAPTTPTTPGGQLPSTGGSSGSPVQLALLLLVAGLAVRVAARRRTAPAPLVARQEPNA